ncbi:MAG: HPr family phosphocarrier protein [Nitrosarchaeum sp.]|nr:HPr family phosphocarrier protein [Nitrosarchaeum sp.]
MIELNLTVNNSRGLHARPSALIVETLTPFKSIVTFFKDDKTINAKSILSVMSLIAKKHSVIQVKIDGPDEIDAANALIRIFDENFREAYE